MTAPDLVPPVPRERRTLHGQDGTALNVELYGPDDAPTVVLAHGWTLAIAIWAPLLRAFGDRYRVVAYDQRGHGASGAPGPAGFTAEAIADDLAAVLTGTVPRGEKAVVAGHSMGGMAIVAAAGRHADVVRDRVAAVVLMSTGMHELTARSRIVPMPLPLAKLATPIATALMAMKPPPGRVEGRQRTMTRYVTLSKQATDAQVDFSTRIINACPPETRAGFARMLARIDLDAVVERLAVPAVVVCGDRDRLTPIWHARRMAAVLPQSLGLVTVPGAGHMTPVEAPRAVDGAVRRLVDEHLAVAGPVEPAASAQPAEPVEPAVTIDITTTDEEIAR